jgi:hypothetical protein
MTVFTTIVCLILAAQTPAQTVEPEHQKNEVYQAVRQAGLPAEGTVARLPEPLLNEQMTGEEQHAALRTLLESSDALDDFLAPGFSAPIKTKLHDSSGSSGVLRQFDIFFTVHARLDEIDIDDFEGQARKNRAADAGGMHVEVRALEADELKKLGVVPTGKMDRYARMEGQLLERVELKMTNRSLGTRTDRSLFVATQTVAGPDGSEALRSVWRPMEGRAGKKALDAWQPYSGAIGYTKVSRLEFRPEALLVEIHGAFAEPKRWFNGKPILKSKITLAAQDKIRELRRDIAKRREKPGS